MKHLKGKVLEAAGKGLLQEMQSSFMSYGLSPSDSVFFCFHFAVIVAKHDKIEKEKLIKLLNGLFEMKDENGN